MGGVPLSRVAIAVVAVALVATTTMAAADVGQTSLSAGEIAAARRDVLLVACAVCRKMAEKLPEIVSEREEAVASGAFERARRSTIREDDVIATVEDMCRPESESGWWIQRLDIVESGDALVLVEHAEPGRCGRECRTIVKACERILDESDVILEASNRIWRGDGTAADLEAAMCHELTTTCARGIPPVPPDRTPGPPFEPMPSDERHADELVRSMRGIEGMPGMKVVRREDYLSDYGNAAGGGYHYDYEHYEDDYEDGSFDYDDGNEYGHYAREAAMEAEREARAEALNAHLATSSYWDQASYLASYVAGSAAEAGRVAAARVAGALAAWRTPRGDDAGEL